MKTRVAILALSLLLLSEFALRRPATAVPPLSPDFVVERRAITGRVTEDDAGNLVQVDYAGRYFNVSNHIRLTVGQPAHYDETIYIFGSSSAFGYSVADADTLASQLQRRFANVRVVNVATIGYGVVQQVNRAKSYAFRPGDIVFVYDGTADTITAYERAYEKLPGWCRETVHTLGYLALVQAFVAPCQDALTVDYETLPTVYAQSSADFRAYVEASGAAYVHVLEPTLYAHGTREMCARGQDTTFRTMFARLRQTPGVLDLSGVLATDDFDDCYHFNAHGARVVADALYSELTIF